MPYRRLPTTDKARLRAMNIALDKAAKSIIIHLPFQEYMLDKLMSLKNTFIISLKQHHHQLSEYQKNRRKYNELLHTAKMFLSHFIQNVYMSIERKEMQPKALQIYGLEENRKLPRLNNEKEILSWGERILLGDKERIQKGGSSIYNPSIAMVRIKLEEFNDQSIYQRNLEKALNRSKENMEKLRKETNQFLAELWDMIEQNIGGNSEEEKRKLAEEYGVVYVFRKKELKKIQNQKDASQSVENINSTNDLKENNNNIEGVNNKDLYKDNFKQAQPINSPSNNGKVEMNKNSHKVEFTYKLFDN